MRGLLAIWIVLLCLGAGEGFGQQSTVGGGSTTVVGGTPVNPNANQLTTNGASTLLNIKASAQLTNVLFKTQYGANGHNFIMQTNAGPGMDIYDYNSSLFTIRYFGDSYGFQWLSDDGNTNWLTLGRNGTSGGLNEKEGILRAYPDNTKRVKDTTQGPNLGAGVNNMFPDQSGSAAAMTGQLFGPELWKRLPVPPIQVVTAGDAIFFDPFTNGNNEAYYTNTINKFNAANFTRQMVANGIPVWFEIETWMASTRDGSGQLQWNNQFPSGGTYMSRYAITNGGLLEPHIDWSAHPGSLVRGIFPGTYAAMTPYTVATDIQWGYALGLAGFRLADGQGDNTSQETLDYHLANPGDPNPTRLGSGDVQAAASFSRQAMAKVAYELLYPGSYTPTIKGYTNMMASDCFVFNGYEVSHSLNSTIPEHSAWLANITSDDQGRRGGPHQAEDIDSAMYQGRLTWTNTAWLIGPGHYNSHVYADNRDLSITDTRAHISMQAMFPGPLWWFGSNVSSTISGAFTNLEFASVFTDRAQQPSFPAFDNGSGGTSAWIKPLADGGFMAFLANEAGSSGNVTLNWSQISSPSNFIPVGSTLYPFTPNTNMYYSVRDVWGAANLGVFNGTITRNITAHNFAWLRFTPMPYYSSELAVTNAGGTIGLHIYNTGNLGTNVLGSTGNSITLAQTNASEGPTFLHLQHKSGAAGGWLLFTQRGATFDIADFGMQGNGSAIGYQRYARQLQLNGVNSTEFQWFNSADAPMGYLGNVICGFPAAVGIGGNLSLTNGFSMASGTNKRAGSATLSSGVITVNNTSVASTDLLFVQCKTPGGTGGTRYKYSLSAATSFTITAVDTAGATVTTDSSVLSWMLVGNP